MKVVHNCNWCSSVMSPQNITFYASVLFKIIGSAIFPSHSESMLTNLEVPCGFGLAQDEGDNVSHVSIKRKPPGPQSFVVWGTLSSFMS